MRTARNSFMALALAAACLLASSSRASAGIVFDQTPPETQLGYFSDTAYTYAAADDFTLASATNLTGLTFYGLYAGGFTYADNFNVSFYQNSGGLPGALLTTFGLSATRTDTGQHAIVLPSGTREIYQYTGNLGSVSLGSGTYWLGITNTDPLADFNIWEWSPFSQTGVNAFKSNVHPTWTSQPGNLAFQLTDGSPSAVPEPSTLASALTGSALLGLAAWRRKRPARA